MQEWIRRRSFSVSGFEDLEMKGFVAALTKNQLSGRERMAGSKRNRGWRSE